jgi:hypothetical protein
MPKVNEENRDHWKRVTSAAAWGPGGESEMWQREMKGSGGTEGGLGLFFFGLCLAIAAGYFFFDSVRVGTAGYGLISGLFRGGYGSGWGTTSMGLIFVPFFIGVGALFYNAKQKWAWFLTWAGLGILVVEILSRIRFFMQMKTTHLLILIIMFAAGTALMLRSYKAVK